MVAAAARLTASDRSQLSTTAIASISIIASRAASRLVSTVVLVGAAGPKWHSPTSAGFEDSSKPVK
jgi:hypothetical protein